MGKNSNKKPLAVGSTGGSAPGTPVEQLAQAAAAEIKPAMVHLKDDVAPRRTDPSPVLEEAKPSEACATDEPGQAQAISARLELAARTASGAEQAALNGVLIELQMARFKAREAAAAGIFNDEEVALLREIAEL